jgi:uncharacterized protein (TIGR03790 family)
LCSKYLHCFQQGFTIYLNTLGGEEFSMAGIPDMFKWLVLFFAIFIVTWILPFSGNALEPGEILVVANENLSGSVAMAQYYMKKRKIAEKDLIILRVTTQETISRIDYDRKVAEPIRRLLEQSDMRSRIRCILIMWGIPLRVDPPPVTEREKDEVHALKKNQRNIEKRLIESKEEKKRDLGGLEKELKKIKREISRLGRSDCLSSLDSEIALVLEKDYPLSGWIPNPYFWGFKDKKGLIGKENVLLVSRLDGPSEKIVKRVIDDTLRAEEMGLNGSAYFDARWPDAGGKGDSAYGFYDRSIHLAAERLKTIKRMDVVVEHTNELFKPGECPHAALYCGWYSLANYVDAFTWQTGAVGYHIASRECVTLRKKSSRTWCKMMLEKGAAATIGPVGEPYVNAFPVPEIFFGFLADGYLSLAECYMISLPYLSWKMVLIGDPLYRPFKSLKTRRFDTK